MLLSVEHNILPLQYVNTQFTSVDLCHYFYSQYFKLETSACPQAPVNWVCTAKTCQKPLVVHKLSPSITISMVFDFLASLDAFNNFAFEDDVIAAASFLLSLVDLTVEVRQVLFDGG